MAKTRDSLRTVFRRAVGTFKRHKVGGSVVVLAALWVVDQLAGELVTRSVVKWFPWVLGRPVGVFGLALFVLVGAVVIHAYLTTRRELKPAKKAPVEAEERLTVNQLREVYGHLGNPAFHIMVELVEVTRARLAPRNRLAELIAQRTNGFRQRRAEFDERVVNDMNCSLREAKKQFKVLHADYVQFARFLHGIADDEIRDDPMFAPEYKNWLTRHREFTATLRTLENGSIYFDLGLNLDRRFDFFDPRNEYKDE